MDLLSRESEWPIKVVEHPDRNGVKITQVGRVVRMQGDLGITYFVDVTDRPDPTTINPAIPNHKGEILGEMLRDGLQGRNDTWNSNNGVVVLITDKFTPTNFRIYVGVCITSEDDRERRDISSYLINQAGFRKSSGYVPMSFDGPNAAAFIMTQEIQDAAKEAGTSSGFTNPAALSELQVLAAGGDK